MVGLLKSEDVEPHIFDQVKLRLVILSDTHGYLDENVAALIRTADVDRKQDRTMTHLRHVISNSEY